MKEINKRYVHVHNQCGLARNESHGLLVLLTGGGGLAMPTVPAKMALICCTISLMANRTHNTFIISLLQVTCDF